MNTLKYFREYEENNPNLRGDEYEGIISSWLPSEVVIHVNDYKLTDLVGKIDIHDGQRDELNLYCMTIINDKDIIDAGENGFLLSERFLEFGNKAVLIFGKDINLFCRKLYQEVSKRNDVNFFESHPKSVKYLERDGHHDKIDVFSKFNEYSWQHEWRIAVFQEGPLSHLSLYLGDLSEIVHVVDTRDIIQKPILLVPNSKPSL